ncbi:MAG: Ldh family oxidoreductase, partial [Planctomycetes bacterium]|nr:Ldh family oxidoreductase [Planctomycetota bacterium]
PHPANGLFGIVIDIQKFLPLTDFRRQVDALIQHVKSSPLAPGFTEILVPGEPEHRERQKRLKEGIFVEDETWRQIVDVATKTGLKGVLPKCSRRV